MEISFLPWRYTEFPFSSDAYRSYNYYVNAHTHIIHVVQGQMNLFCMKSVLLIRRTYTFSSHVISPNHNYFITQAINYVAIIIVYMYVYIGTGAEWLLMLT